jgi:Na+/proline symporter
MSYQRYEKKKKTNPMLPLIGFVIMAVGGGFSYLAAPGVIKFLETTTFVFGFFGPILPIAFPGDWPPLLTRGVVAGMMFLVIFTLMMVVIFAIIKPPHEESHVDISDVRKVVQARKKRK